MRGSFFNENNNVDVQRNRETSGMETAKIIENRILSERDEWTKILKKAIKSEVNKILKEAMIGNKSQINLMDSFISWFPPP